jgi:flavorubredoxin
LSITTSNPLPRELADGLYWLGACYAVPVGGRSLHANNSVFLVAGSKWSALVEAGISWDTRTILQQIRDLTEARGLPPLRYVFVTHSEQAHSAGVGHLLAHHAEASAHGDVTDLHMVFPEHLERMRFADPGDRFDLGGREILVVEGLFRDLITTRWFWDSGSRALFTGDGISYGHYHTDSACGMCIEEAERVDVPQQMKFFGVSAFHWTKFVDIEPYADRLDEIVFGELHAELVLPTHGLPVTDPAATMPKIREGLIAMSHSTRLDSDAAFDIFVPEDG